MQPIDYNRRPSSFAERIRIAMRESDALSRAVEVHLDPGGYNRDAIIEIRPDNPDTFFTDWSGSDPSRFSARLRAAATALRDLRIHGLFRAAHTDGRLTICRV